MATPSNTRSGGPNFLGGEHAPFVISGYPNSDGFRLSDVVLPQGIAEGRMKTRRDLRLALDRMKRTAYRVWRWTERMNFAAQDAGEYGRPPEELFPADAVPATLKALLRFIAEDYLPEVRAYVAFTNAWLAERPDLAPGTSGFDRPQDRRIGEVEFVWRGHSVRVGVVPYRLYLLQKVQDVADRASPADRADMQALLAETGLSDLLNLHSSRRIERVNHLEVWGDLK
jgi:hypothetical protein